MKILILVISLLLAKPSTSKSLSESSGEAASLEELLKNITTSGSQLFQKLSGVKDRNHDDLSDLFSHIMKTLSGKMLSRHQLKNLLDTLGIQPDFMKPLEKMMKLASKLDFKMPSSISYYSNGNISQIVENLIKIINKTREYTAHSSGIRHPLTELLYLPSEVAEFSASQKNDTHADAGENSDAQAEEVTVDNISMSASNIWMVIKSMWEKIIAHVKEENSLAYFMDLTPVRIIDHILSLGDDVNLMNFLAKKLDPSLAEFVAKTVSPYLGPLRDFETFYNFLKENGLNGILDYFGTKRFQYTFNTITKVASAYLEDTVTDDIVSQYIDFISFDNTELHKFYDSVMKNLHKNANKNDTDETNDERIKRDIFQDIASIYKYSDNSEYSSSDNQNSQYAYDHYTGNSDFSPQDPNYTVAGSDFEARGPSYAHDSMNYGSTGSYYSSDVSSNEVNNSTDDTDPDSRQLPVSRYGIGGAYFFDPARDGYGYGGGGGYGGGYGGGMTMDPYLILGSLILGSLLGFLLFRALRGTRRGRRDINDGSLSLWDSDIPTNLFWGDSNADRMKRSALSSNSSEGAEPNVPASLRGDVWSSDPLVGDGYVDDLVEVDIADNLNHLWEIYQENNETACVQSHLCGYVAKSTAEHLTNKDSSISLLMASLSNMLGVNGSGQLVDDITQSLVVGKPYSCPSVTGCHFSL